MYVRKEEDRGIEERSRGFKKRLREGRTFENTDTYSDQERSIEKARGMQRLVKQR